MITQPLLEYIERQFGRNIPVDDIRKKLLSAGWDEKDAEEGLSTIERKLGKILSSTSPSSKVSPNTEEVKKRSIIPVVLLITGIVFVLGVISALAYWKYALGMKPLFSGVVQAEIVPQAIEKASEPDPLTEVLATPTTTEPLAVPGTLIQDDVQENLSLNIENTSAKVAEIDNTETASKNPVAKTQTQDSSVSAFSPAIYTPEEIATIKSVFKEYFCKKTGFDSTKSMDEADVTYLNKTLFAQLGNTYESLMRTMAIPEILAYYDGLNVTCRN